MRHSLKNLVSKLGQKYSDRLRIDVSKEPFKWFLASILYGAPITETSATNTYHEFERRGLTTPRRIIDCGWDGLVECLDSGGYTRYDFKTADKLLEACGNLLKRYGDLNNLYNLSKDSRDLEERLMSLAKGIGPTTVSIFLRDMRQVWRKADPRPSTLALLAAKNLGIKDLKKEWKKNVPEFQFSEFETALMQLARDYCRKERCGVCPAEGCEYPIHSFRRKKRKVPTVRPRLSSTSTTHP